MDQQAATRPADVHGAYVHGPQPVYDRTTDHREVFPDWPRAAVLHEAR